MLNEELKEIPLFEGLSDQQLTACAELFQASEVLMGEELTKEDEFGYSLVLVVSGRVVVKRGDKEVAELHAGDHFGEVSLIAHKKRNATVVAAQACRIAKVMTWNFEKFLAVDPVLQERLAATAAARAEARNSGAWDISSSP